MLPPASLAMDILVQIESRESEERIRKGRCCCGVSIILFLSSFE
jgi:hypothetical protein